MDTPDKAAGLADVQIADAVNKEWLVRSSCSARSSQISSNLRGHREQLSVSINASDIFYGSMPTSKYIGAGARPTLGPADGTTSLIDNSIGGGSRRASKPENYYHLYDNIGFADSALLVGSNSSRESAGIHNDGFYRHDKSSLGTDASSQPQGGLWSCCCFRGKFRIFLACYVLLGITLAIYSRNALSLAAVGMVANNVADKELVSILAASLAASTTTDGHHLIAASNQSNINTTAIANNDGSCLISDRHLERRQHDANSQRAAIGNVISELPPGLDFKQAHKYQIEQAFKASIKRRVERGELVDWSPSEQGLIFAAGSVGNLLISIPITRLGEIYGPKWVIFAALAGATIQAALMPLIAPSHIALVIMFQVLFSGLSFGADCVAYTLFAYWLTPTEIAFFVACLVVCYQLGAILSNVITAQILIRALDWSWCFYVPAILCGLWTLVWMLIGASEPAKSSIISRDELDYIVLRSKLSRAGADHHDGRRSSSSYYESTDDLSRQCDNYEDDDDDDDKENAKQNCQHRPVSWLKLARDPNIWAIIAVKFTLRWYFSVNISLMPTYLTTVAHMSVDTIGKFSAMQSVIGLVSGVFMGYITKSAVSKRPFNLSLPAFRKIFQSVVNFGLAGSLVVFITFDCDLWVTVVTLTIACVCVNFYVAAALQLPLDLSPSYCGLITSITNTLALGQAIGAPISGLILNKAPKDRNLWRIVWGIAILLNILSGLLFILLVNSKPKDYSKSRPSTQKKKSKS